MSRSLRSTRRNSTDINPIVSCVCLQHGESQRVSTTECDGDLRVKLLCHRYVISKFHGFAVRGQRGDFQFWSPSTVCASILADEVILSDRLRLEQEDEAHDALRPPSLPRTQPQRRRPPPHAQPNIRRGDRARCEFEKESGDHCEGEDVGCQGHEWQGEGYDGVVRG